MSTPTSIVVVTLRTSIGTVSAFSAGGGSSTSLNTRGATALLAQWLGLPGQLRRRETARLLARQPAVVVTLAAVRRLGPARRATSDCTRRWRRPRPRDGRAGSRRSCTSSVGHRAGPELKGRGHGRQVQQPVRGDPRGLQQVLHVLGEVVVVLAVCIGDSLQIAGHALRDAGRRRWRRPRPPLADAEDADDGSQDLGTHDRVLDDPSGRRRRCEVRDPDRLQVPAGATEQTARQCVHQLLRLHRGLSLSRPVQRQRHPQVRLRRRERRPPGAVVLVPRSRGPGASRRDPEAHQPVTDARAAAQASRSEPRPPRRRLLDSSRLGLVQAARKPAS